MSAQPVISDGHILGVYNAYPPPGKSNTAKNTPPEGSFGLTPISPDNHWLVTGSLDNTARLWNLRLDELINLACRTTGRNLTQTEV